MEITNEKEFESSTVCPVCGMTIDPATAMFTDQYDGEAFFFCSKECHEQFLAAPEKYVSKQS